MHEFQRYFGISRNVYASEDGMSDEELWDKAKRKYRVEFERDRTQMKEAGYKFGPIRYREDMDPMCGKRGIWYSEIREGA